MGEGLSPAVQRAIPRAIRTVIRQAKAWTPRVTRALTVSQD